MTLSVGSVSGRLRPLAFAAIAGLASATAVSAQAPRQAPARPARPARPAPHAGSVEIGGGIAFGGGTDFGSANAELTRNPGTGSGPYDLFTTSTTLNAGFGFQLRVGGYLSKSLAIEGGVRLLRPDVETRITADAESADDTTATERLDQYVFDGSLVFHFTQASFAGGRGVPFVTGGAGYIRDLHEGNELMETGVEYHATGGVKYWLSDRPRRAGIRAEGGVSIRDGGYDFDGGRRTVPIGTVSVVYLF